MSNWWVAVPIVIALLVLIVTLWSIKELNIRTTNANQVISELVDGIIKLEKATDFLGITGVKEGFPRHMEAAWEDVGAHGRFLTDLGGMSIKMREQLVQDFFKALHKPISSTPPAGSIADILIDVDRDLTRRELQKDDKLVLVQQHEQG